MMLGKAKKTLQSEVRHPLNKIGNPYSQDFRAYILDLVEVGNFNQDVIREALNNPLFPCEASISWWRKHNVRLAISDHTREMETKKEKF